MEPLSRTRSESAPAWAFAPDRIVGPRPWVRWVVAVLLRVGLGVSLLNGGLLGYLMARRGGPASGLAWSTLLGPAAVAGVLENDLLVPFVQIAIGLALILGFFTVVAAVLAGCLILSAPIFQFLTILSNSGPMNNTTLAMQALVTTGSINLLLLVAAVLWLTPIEGTPWSLDFVIFAHRRPGLASVSTHAAPAPAPVSAPPTSEAAPPPSPAAPEAAAAAALSATLGE